MSGVNLISAVSLDPQTMVSQAMPTTESALYTVGGSNSAELFSFTICNVSNNLVPTLTKGTTSTSGGTLPANTYYWALTAVSANGESLVSNQVTATTTGSTSSQPFTWAAAPGAATYTLYRGTTSGVYTVAYTGLTGTSYTDTNATNISQSPPTTSAFGQPIPVWLDICQSGGTLTDGTHRILNGFPLGANDTLSLMNYLGRAMLGPGDSVGGYAQYASSVDVVVTGVVAS